jgi:hypothetical protein
MYDTQTVEDHTKLRTVAFFNRDLISQQTNKKTGDNA